MSNENGAFVLIVDVLCKSREDVYVGKHRSGDCYHEEELTVYPVCMRVGVLCVHGVASRLGRSAYRLRKLT